MGSHKKPCPMKSPHQEDLDIGCWGFFPSGHKRRKKLMSSNTLVDLFVMEWYYGSEMTDFLVPEDQDLLDRHPSPENWSKWGISPSEDCNPPKNFMNMDSNAKDAEFNFIDESFNNEVRFESSQYDKAQSSSSSVCGVPQQTFQQAAFSCDQPNYHLQEISSFEQTDDIFLDSMLGDFPRVENQHKSFYYYPENQCNTPDGLQKDISGSEFVPCNSNSNDFLDIEKVKISDLFEQSSGNETMHKQSTIEESTLEDLETIISQFNDKTRISFRDALYRLARNTKQQNAVEDLDGDLTMQQPMPWTVHNELESLRSEKNEPMESETNSVDRAVANLMFNGTAYCECRSN